MKKRKNILKIAIDSPAAAGAGTLAKSISKHYSLIYLDTGKIFRHMAYLKLKFPKKPLCLLLLLLSLSRVIILSI